jgi:hypothetical protein
MVQHFFSSPFNAIGTLTCNIVPAWYGLGLHGHGFAQSWSQTSIFWISDYMTIALYTCNNKSALLGLAVHDHYLSHPWYPYCRSKNCDNVSALLGLELRDHYLVSLIISHNYQSTFRCSGTGIWQCAWDTIIAAHSTYKVSQSNYPRQIHPLDHATGKPMESDRQILKSKPEELYFSSGILWRHSLVYY